MASSASARAGINIALIKYWGKRDDALNLPSVGSLSLTIDTFVTETTVTFAASQPDDVFVLNGRQQDDKRVFVLIDQLRQLAGVDIRAVVESTNTVPTASGLASSASGTAALALAAWSALGLGHERSDRKQRFFGCCSARLWVCPAFAIAWLGPTRQSQRTIKPTLVRRHVATENGHRPDNK